MLKVEGVDLGPAPAAAKSANALVTAAPTKSFDSSHLDTGARSVSKRAKTHRRWEVQATQAYPTT